MLKNSLCYVFYLYICVRNNTRCCFCIKDISLVLSFRLKTNYL